MKLQKLQEEFPLEGILSIYRSKDGILKELIYKESNLITLATRQLFLSYVYQYPGITSDPVTGLKVGTGGTIDPQGLFPKQEDPSWTALNTTITTIGTGGLLTVSNAVDNTVPQVTFLCDLDQGTANGNLITEAGLFRASGNIFNVKTFPGIPKTSEFSLHFSWTIKMA
jgi:hypothetical protein